MATITTLDRLKVELGKPYFDDEIFTQYLMENNLVATDQFMHTTMKRDLLLTVYDILQALSNDLELFRRIDTEYATTGEAYASLQKRLLDVEKRINAIPDPDANYSNVSYLFYG